MKRAIAVIFLVVLCLGGLPAQTPIHESTPTIVWNAVTEYIDDTPIPVEVNVEYDVYIWDMAGGDPTVQPVESLTYFGRVQTPEVTLSFPYGGDWAVGVRAVATLDATSETSDLAYSTRAEDTAGDPFIFAWIRLYVPKLPTGLGVQGL